MSKHEFCAGVLFFCCLGLFGVGVYLALAAAPDWALAAAMLAGICGGSVVAVRLVLALWRRWRIEGAAAALDRRMAERMHRELHRI